MIGAKRFRNAIYTLHGREVIAVWVGPDEFEVMSVDRARMVVLFGLNAVRKQERAAFVKEGTTGHDAPAA